VSKVVIIKCNSYEQQVVDDAVERGVSLLGGVVEFVNSADKVLLKPNLLIGDPPKHLSQRHRQPPVVHNYCI